jgi:concanavalin A-like lectin/glucanase superfamily protein
MKLSSRLSLALLFAPLVVAQTNYQTDVLALNPLGFWPLNGNASDFTANANNGALRNGAFFSSLFTSPAEPQSLVLTGAKNQFISMPTTGSSIFNLGSLHALTAMAWVKTVSQGNGFVSIVGKFDPGSNTGWAIGFDNSNAGDPGSSGRFELIFGAANTTLAVEAPVARTDGGWHLVAATYDGGGRASGVQLYIDGLPVASPIVAVDSIASGSILNAAPLTIGADASGSSQFDGNISGVAVFGAALTPAQILQLADDATTARAFLGQFAFGGGWYSAIYFTNIGLSEVSFPVSFTADNGTPLTVPSIGGSSKTITLAAGASTVIEAPNAGALVQGYVTITVPPGVTGYGVFRQSIPGIPDQEAVVSLSPAVANVPLLFDETKYISGVSIVNPGSLSTTVFISAIDNTGAPIGTSTVLLAPFNKTAIALRSLPGLSGIVGKQGSARFSVTGAQVVVLGLRFNGVAFTSIPTQPQSSIFKFIGTP